MHTTSLLTRRSRNRLMRGFSVLAILATLLLGMPWSAPAANAAQLTTVRMYLSRQTGGLASGEQFELFFTPATTLTGSTNHVILTFPGSNGTWCKTNAGTLTLTAITAPTPTIQTAESATGILGTVTGACTTNPDTFTISAVGALQAGTKYGVRIAGNSSAIGTAAAGNNIKYQVDTQQASTPTDTYTAALSLVTSDQYTVSATVDPTLSVALSATTLNLSGVNALDTTHVNYQGVTSTVTTNAKNGYVSVVSYSGVLSNGTDTIADAGGTATPGTAGFGASTSQSTQTVATSNVTPSCSTTQQQQTGAANATSLTTTGKQFASASAPASSDATTLCFLLAIAGTTPPGAYSTTVTLVTTARF